MNWDDLDLEWMNVICFLVAAILAVLAHFYPEAPNNLADFASLAAGAALRGMGTDK